MLMYVDEVLREIDAVQQYASIVREKFDAGRDTAELLLDAKALDLRMDNLGHASGSKDGRIRPPALELYGLLSGKG